MKGKIRHVLFPAVLAGLTIFVIATIWDIKYYGIIFACFGSSPLNMSYPVSTLRKI